MSKFDPAEVPGYLEAVKREQLLRDVAFLPIGESIGPFEVTQLKLRQFLLLRIAHHPLLYGKTPTPAQLSQFLWILSPQFNQRTRSWARTWHDVRCRWHFRNPVHVMVIIASARKYLDDSFLDLNCASSPETWRASYWSDGITVCSILGNQFGYTQETVMDMPVRRSLQFLRIAQQMTNPDIPLGNPSEKLISDWLEIRQPQRKDLQ